MSPFGSSIPSARHQLLPVLLLLLAAVSGRARAEILLRPERPVLLAQPGRTLPVTITVTGAEGEIRADELHLFASSGRLVEPRPMGNNTFQASFRLPRRRHPLTVLLAAWVPGQVPGLAVVRLLATTTLPINTDKPNVSVTLRLGNRTFGPVRTDARGRCRVQVEIDPAYLQAQALAVDDFGNRTVEPVQLPLPDFPLMVVFSSRDSLAANGNDRAEVWVLQVGRDGRPLRKPAFTTSVDRGQVLGTETVRPGIFRVTLQAPRGLRPPVCNLTVADGRQAHTHKQVLRYSLTPGRPVRLLAEAHPDSLAADGISSNEINISISDAAGNAVSVPPPEISCSRGQVSPATESDPGRFRARYTAPQAQAGPVECRVRLEEAALETTLVIKVVPVRAETLDVETANYQLVADGHSRAVLNLTARDGKGRLLPGVTISGRAAVGRLSKVIDDGGGHYHAVYFAPRRREATRVRLFFEAEGGDSARADIELELSKPPEPPLSLPRGWLGLWAGARSNLGLVTSALLSLELGLRPFSASWFYLQLETGYRFGQHRQEGVRFDIDTLQANLLLQFRLLARRRLSPWLAVGGGAFWSSWRLLHATGNTEAAHRLLPGLVAALGADVRVGNLWLFINLRYSYAWLHQYGRVDGGGQGSLVKGNVGGLEAGAGVRLCF